MTESPHTHLSIRIPPPSDNTNKERGDSSNHLLSSSNHQLATPALTQIHPTVYPATPSAHARLVGDPSNCQPASSSHQWAVPAPVCLLALGAQAEPLAPPAVAIPHTNPNSAGPIPHLKEIAPLRAELKALCSAQRPRAMSDPPCIIIPAPRVDNHPLAIAAPAL